MTFKAKTKYANRFKSLFELLFNNMTTVCLTIDQTGLSLKTTTSQNITFDVQLPSHHFDEYVFGGLEPIHVGLGNKVKKFFKTVKNKSIVEFSITDPFLFDIIITALDNQNNCKSLLSVTIASVQNIAPFDSIDYKVPSVRVPNTNFSKMCRSFMTPTFYLSKTNGELEFGSTMINIFKESFRFGVADSTDTSAVFHRHYRTDQIIRIIKMASLVPKHLSIYVEKGLPLLVKSTSEIGTVKVYINAMIDDTA